MGVRLQNYSYLNFSITKNCFEELRESDLCFASLKSLSIPLPTTITHLKQTETSFFQKQSKLIICFNNIELEHHILHKIKNIN